MAVSQIFVLIKSTIKTLTSIAMYRLQVLISESASGPLLGQGYPIWLVRNTNQAQVGRVTVRLRLCHVYCKQFFANLPSLAMEYNEI